MFKKILIANRGEIAVRIIQACQGLGIATVAVYTDADACWLARELADEAVNIGSGPAADSYINFDKVIDAAKRTNADAIHPGYGFLAENADFARRCEQEGLVFIGPSADVIDLMGNKAKAKALVENLSIPIIPGAPYQQGQSDSSDQEITSLINLATDIGFPVMLKAVSGGGGMGIRIVERASELSAALASVQQEAQSAFGDDRVLVEKYFPAVRHIEVQVLADQHGHAVHCYERECSVQRRRQKVIEEAPSTFVSKALREKLCEASLKIVHAVDYYSVGTVEFVVVDRPNSEDFYFLEMNTRLQVEHGVTEAVTGLDLVQLQIQVAEGHPLSFMQSDIVLKGHAIEARLCAEQPSQHFQPITGTVAAWSTPAIDKLRIDTGIKAGTTISAFYDSLMAKIIAIEPTRERALRTLCHGLRQTCLLGLDTNQRFLLNIINDQTFIDGLANTTYIEHHEPQLLTPLSKVITHEIAIVGAVVLAVQDTKKLHPGQGGAFTRQYHLCLQGIEHAITLHCVAAHQYQLRLEEQDYTVMLEEQNRSDDHTSNPPHVRLAINGIEKLYRTRIHQQHLFIHIPGAGSFTLTRPSVLPDAPQTDTDHSYTAAMAGQVVSILTRAGACIVAGEKLLVIESMKMEHSILAKADGRVDCVLVDEGSAVQSGSLLLRLHDQEELV